MTRVVALLRGVNVGKRRLPMATLRDALVAAGCGDVETYVQSGNVVLTPHAGAPAGPDLAPWLEQVIGDVAGFAVPVVVRTGADMAAIVARNPYPAAGGTQLHVVACGHEPPSTLLHSIDLSSVAPEHATVVGAEVYLHLPGGMGRAALPVRIERELRAAGVLGTARNWNTIERLADLVR